MRSTACSPRWTWRSRHLCGPLDAHRRIKSHNRRFDGYRAHLSVDPDAELIDEVIVTPANTHDSVPVADLLATHAEDEV
ncbi:MAG: transposase, partial [Actinomycetota bacterium]|nr:transposase [Actinomycetota bacterium]